MGTMGKMGKMESHPPRPFMTVPPVIQCNRLTSRQFTNGTGLNEAWEWQKSTAHALFPIFCIFPIVPIRDSDIPKEDL